MDDKEIEALGWWHKCLAWLMRSLIINYCFIHKIGKIYVNMKTKEVTFEINRKQEASLMKYSGKAKKYHMEDAVFDRLKDILKKRSDKDFEESKFDQKTETDYLKEQLREQKAMLETLIESINPVKKESLRP